MSAAVIAEAGRNLIGQTGWNSQTWAEETLARLSLREKIGQTAQERINASTRFLGMSLEEWFERYPVGSVFCGGEIISGCGDTAESSRAAIQTLQAASRLPLLVSGDLESGAGAAVKGLTRMPSALALGATNDTDLAYEYGRWTALEGRQIGFTWTFAPVVDLLRNWLNPVVSNRGLGVSPRHVGRMASAVIRGVQDHGMAACAKHFPGDGVDFRDQHLVTSINSLSEAEWRETYLRVFAEVIQSGVHTIMSGHIALPWLEPLADGERPRPATVSHRVLGFLRDELEFDGVIVSDALEMAGFTGWGRYEDRIIEAFNAGIDVMLWPQIEYFDVMERAVMDGRVTEARLDESVRRILRLKARLGLPGAPLPGATTGGPIVLSDEARQTARKVAESSITLVRNEENILPLDPAKVRRVLLHCAVGLDEKSRDDLSTLVQDFRDRGVEVSLLQNGNCLDVISRERLGERWDAYIVVFSLQIHQLKNTVRPVGQIGEVMWTLQNAETVRPIVVSLGTPYLLQDMPFLKTLVNAYSPSTETQTALARTLWGEIPFSEFSPVDVGGEWHA
ncbi:beta-N-acetylhexosaminidase [Terrimicrobium sacchariphilum]|uniref:beta-N-acetylhexosaminidase n=1 Tax=Terrimicrobium sacchariphilum TaxID=690879 RepID=A0A146G492_TERSA|nr:glycoside hydrolase family 3 N-terminal domain-containing protein [Terrimicrobium sacchariphilum]GAT32629.1 beta-N-acetylhexosaminidase [Terrimicrobium sacchariphilum]